MNLFKEFFSRPVASRVDGDNISKDSLNRIQTKVYEIFTMFQHAETYQPYFECPDIEFNPKTMQRYKDCFFIDGKIRNITVIFSQDDGEILTARISDNH